MVADFSQWVTFDEFGDAIGRAATVLRANAVAADLATPVPTCPGWSMLDLVAHVGMAHRWAASHVRGHPIDPAGAQALERQGRDHHDVLGWFDDGATALLQALVDASEDLEALVFLENAPSPKLFWTRRQTHETTVHAVDALSARLGRAPRPDETWIPAALAADGIDELVRGFAPRREGLHPDTETRLLVRPDGGGVAWLMELGPDHPVRSTLLEGAGAADVQADQVLTGTAVDLYLRLWNRAGEAPADRAHPSGRAERWWREHVSVTWA